MFFTKKSPIMASLKTKKTEKSSSEARGILQSEKDFEIFTQLEGKKKMLPYNMKTHYKISYLNSTSKLFCGKQMKEFQGPILFFSNPMSSYTVEPTSEAPKGFFCLFDNNFLGFKSNVMKSTLVHLEHNPIYALTPEQDMLISYLFEKMAEESLQNYPQKHEVLRNYVEIIIHQASRFQVVFQTNTFKNAPHRLCSQFLELVEKQFPITRHNQSMALKTPNDYAAKLDVHTNHLNHTLKTVLGKSTSTILTERLILEAQDLLKTTDWSISQIAYALGFEYPTYFSSFFKKGTGITANEYRKN